MSPAAMGGVFLLVLVTFTSLATWGLAFRRGPLAARSVANAFGRTIECAGATVVFFGLNLALGFVVILAARALAGAFVSLYALADTTLLVLSFLQAVAFHWWWRGT